MLLNGPWVNPRHGRGPRAKVTALASRGTAYESINNWDHNKCKCRDAAATLHAHEINKMTDQTEIAIINEVNSFLLGKGSNKRRITSENKALCALKLGDLEEAKIQKTVSPLMFGRF